MAEASHWDRNYQGAAVERHAVSEKSHLVRRRFGSLPARSSRRRPGRRCSKVGCAPGDWLVTFAREFGFHPTGIDFAPSGCAAAREKLAGAGIDGKVIEADILRWSPGDERFDVIFFQGSLEHFPDPAEGLGRGVSAARPGALILAQLPCLAPWHINGVINRLLDTDGLADHYTRDLDEMERAFRAAGIARTCSPAALAPCS